MILLEGCFRATAGQAMNNLTRSLAAAAFAITAAGTTNAIAASILASATRTKDFVSTSTSELAVPLKDNGATTLLFMTSVDDELVKITYNAECVVTGTRGKWVSVRILVDGAEALPASGHDFALCTAVDNTGKTWTAAARQSVFKVPTAGMHTVTVMARLNVGLLGGTGTWRLDDSSLVVEKSVTKSATRVAAFQSTTAGPVPPDLLPLKDNGGKTLGFDTAKNNEFVRISYNAECVVAAPAPGKVVLLYFNLDGAMIDPVGRQLCGSVDTTGKTWLGAINQFVHKVPTPGTHALKIYGVLNTGSGTWRLDDSSLVVESAVLTFASRSKGFDSTSTAEVAVPLKNNGLDTLPFTTTDNNQLVTITYNARCSIAAPRGTWVSVRVVVDGQNAHPASGSDFAMCSSIQNGIFHYVTAIRQSTFTVPTAGDHQVQIFARSSQAANWALGYSSLVIR
jgi:hypothetical protein